MGRVCLWQSVEDWTLFDRGINVYPLKVALSLHSPNEPGELSQWLCHDDSTVNIVVVIIIIIIIIIIMGIVSK